MEVKRPGEKNGETVDSHESEIDLLEEEIKSLSELKTGAIESFTGRVLAYGALSLWIVFLYYFLERGATFLLKRLIVMNFPVPGIVASLIVAYTFQPAKRRIFDYVSRRRR